MNCNTTHYRANSSSVPGDPTLGERLRSAVEQLTLRHRTGEVLVTCSIGIATSCNPEEPSVVKRADDALYHAKNHGRNRVVAAAA